MTLIDLLKNESTIPHRNIYTMAAISGISNAGILAIINAAAGSATEQETNFQYLMLFAVAMTLYIYTQRYTFYKVTIIVETIVDKLRTRIASKVRRSNLLTLEHIGRSEIYSRLTQGTTLISQSAGQLVAAMQSAIMVVFSIFYIAAISIEAFGLTIALIIGGVFIYLRTNKKIIGFIQRSTRKEVEFFGFVTHTLDGFKETKMNSQRSEDLEWHTNKVSTELKHYRMKTATLNQKNYIFSQAFFYVLLAAIVFLLPRLVETYTENVTEISAAILFIIGPLSTVVGGIPLYQQANFSAMDIQALERDIDNHRSETAPEQIVKPLAPDFQTLTVEKLAFTYRDHEGKAMFNFGPIDLTVEAGTTVFVVGGNGCGKSTFLKLLTSLYIPDEGVIKLDKVVVDDTTKQGYREMFSVIFGDFHLFDRLYGITNPDEERVNALLTQMQLNTKTEYRDGRFTELDLSTGQKKRLALVVALIEDRPIFIFDEWAAEQDPEFRRYFYEELLQELQSRGKTVIAVTHDDKYFDVADKIVTLDYGKISKIVDTKHHKA